MARASFELPKMFNKGESENKHESCIKNMRILGRLPGIFSSGTKSSPDKQLILPMLTLRYEAGARVRGK